MLNWMVGVCSPASSEQSATYEVLFIMNTSTETFNNQHQRTLLHKIYQLTKNLLR